MLRTVENTGQRYVQQQAGGAAMQRQTLHLRRKIASATGGKPDARALFLQGMPVVDVVPDSAAQPQMEQVVFVQKPADSSHVTRPSVLSDIHVMAQDQARGVPAQRVVAAEVVEVVPPQRALPSVSRLWPTIAMGMRSPVLNSPHSNPDRRLRLHMFRREEQRRYNFR